MYKWFKIKDKLNKLNKFTKLISKQEVIYFIPLYIQNPNLMEPLNKKFEVQLPWNFIRWNYSSPVYCYFLNKLLK